MESIQEIKREEYEQDAIEARMLEGYEVDMEAKGYEKCKWCDEWVYKEDSQNGLCEACIDDFLENVTLKEVMEYASTLDEESEYVLYTQYLFNSRQVIEILKKEASNIASDFLFRKEITNYIANDIGHYLDYLEEKEDL